MKLINNIPTIKIIASYLILAAIAIFVCLFLYQQLQQDKQSSISEEKKVLNTSAFISALYEADSYASLSLQSLKEEDFNTYVFKNDSLIESIQFLKRNNTIEFEGEQLDTITALLNLKKKNIEQLRLIKKSNNQDETLDAILSEFENLENNMGRMTLRNFIKNPEELNEKQLKTILEYTNYVNSKKTTVSSNVIDTMLTSSREIVKSAKKSNIRLQKILLEKENMLVRNDLKISLQLKKIISKLSATIKAKQQLETQQKNKAIYDSNRVVKIAGWSGIFLIILFSYFIISDFFKAQKLKNALQLEQHKTKSVLESREQLIASVSHDLKTPLTTISGYTKLLQNTNLNNEQYSFTNAINENAEYISHLAQDLLDFSKLEANKLSIVNKPFNLYNLLEKIMNDAKMVHSKDNVLGVLKLDNSLKNKYFINDAKRIEQIVTNLISNAFKFTNNGTVTLTARLEKNKQSNTNVIISISDTGIGIEPTKQHSIFEAFTQADTTISSNYGGSGLGLAISKKLATLLKATLSLESEPNKGSNFNFSIPLLETEKPTSKNIKTPHFKTGVIIDDDAGLLTLLKSLFKTLQIEVYCFSSFAAFKNNTPKKFDFVLTDMQMPNVSGLEILQKLKEGIIKSYNNQPLYLMSGNLQSNKNEYLEKGFSGVLPKPFTIEQLASLLKISEAEILKNKTISVKANNKKYKKFNPEDLEYFLTDKEALKDIIEVFISENSINLKNIYKAIISKNGKQIATITHKMRTMCTQLNARFVLLQIAELEEANKTENSTENLFDIYSNLKSEVNLLNNELNHYLNQ